LARSISASTWVSLSPQAVAFLRAQAARDVDDVVALVAVVGKAHVDAAQFEVAQPHRHREDVHLAPGIVDVVLALHGMAGGFEQVRHAGAERGAAAVPDMQRAIGVGRDELDLYRLARLGRGVPVTLAVFEHAPQRAQAAGLVQMEIDEARAGDLDLGDVLRARHRGGEGLGQFARLAPGRLGQQQGDIGRVVAVLAGLAAFDHEGRLGLVRQVAVALEIEQGLQHQFAQMVFHGILGKLNARTGPEPPIVMRALARCWRRPARSRPRHRHQSVTPRS
jgi:hypothetical protein